jgi:hypothetical protein
VAAVIVPTVPYTGTNFVCELFRKAGYQVVGLSENPTRAKYLRQCHVLKSTQIELAAAHAKTMPVVIPLRHPFRVEESWKRKGLNVADMIRAFRTIDERFTRFCPYFLPIDHERREDYLDSLRAIEPDMETDWPVIESKSGTHGLRLDDLSPSPEVVALVQELDYLRRLYG